MNRSRKIELGLAGALLLLTGLVLAQGPIRAQRSQHLRTDRRPANILTETNTPGVPAPTQP